MIHSGVYVATYFIGIFFLFHYNYRIMGLIKKATELEIPTTIKMMVYGQAGMGKSTFALSAEKPLLLDFDNGVKRVNMSHLDGVDIVQITSWQDVQMVLREDLSAYRTIVTDTAGKMGDYITQYVCGNKQPRLQDWGKMNLVYTDFLRQLDMLCKNLVYVCHRDTRKEGDDTVYIPALRDKWYNIIVSGLDLLGYLEMKSEGGRQVRTITFDPTNRNDGKNTCNLPSYMEIPTIVDAQGRAIGKNNFIQEKIVKPYIDMLTQKRSDLEEYNKVIDEIRDAVDFVCDADTANQFVATINNYNHVGSSLEVARKMFTEKAASLGLVYNKISKQYEPAA